jgi:hypothetical protein
MSSELHLHSASASQLPGACGISATRTGATATSTSTSTGGTASTSTAPRSIRRPGDHPPHSYRRAAMDRSASRAGRLVCRQTRWGEPAFKVPSSAVNRPTQRPAQMPARPNAPTAGAGAVQRPAQQPARANAPATRQAPAASQLQAQNCGGALSGVGDGARAGQYSARGNQSLQARQQVGGGVRGGGGGAARGGGVRGRP